jgi:membrane protease YdiL (CAAX protease family)
MADEFGPVRAAATAIALLVSVLLFASVYGAGALALFDRLGVGLDPTGEQLVGMLTFQGLAVGTVAAAYFLGRSAVNARIGLRTPTRDDARWIAGGLVTIIALFVAANIALEQLGIEPAQHALSQLTDPTAVLLIGALGVTLVPVGEELLLRCIVQGTLRDAFPAHIAIGGASVLFSIVHVTALLANSANPGQAQAATLGIIFLLSLVLGTVYERTDTIIVPAAVHAGFNLLQFATLYLDVAG